MEAVSIETQLQEMRTGDRVRYRGIDWDIADYSTYHDEKGYQTDEWLLQSSGGTECYLLREYDPENISETVNWYISNAVKNTGILLPNSPEDITSLLWEQMKIVREPYPELRVMYKSYYFDSETQGEYQTSSTTEHRITWDYWNKEHTTNLAIEAFSGHQLDIYTTKAVRTEEFYNIQKGVKKPTGGWNANLAGEAIGAIIFIFTGLLFFIFG